MTRIAVRFAALLLLGLATAAPLVAQDTALPNSPRFQSILRLAQDGRSDSARALIATVLKTTETTDPAYPEALYTAATIASSGDEARLLFSRVAVEFARSGWGDKALLRLAQLDYGAGDSQGTVTRVDRLITTYPQSSVLADATLWGARAALERGDAPRACTWLDLGLERVGQNVELRNQIEFTRRQCTAEARSQVPAPTQVTPIRTPERRPVDQAPVRSPATPPVKTPEKRPTDTVAVTNPVRPPVTPPTTTPDRPTPNPPAAAGPWRIQVAAVSDPAAIARLERAIKAAGLTAYRSNSPGGLTRVQAGPFATREAADAALPGLTAAVGGQPFVTRVP
ncbi:MAG TPA: SPOR domain-containing protein [Gemmatimonadales bacterium]|nr:SPOR domain-containing protein [Gemmatimonadales bacterium]